ncbi:MAG TPA: nucleotidyltransferase family protein [Syntrophales bacterium]|nr:nucleotidyltransferase family protein [Syntrophales bacterium]HOM08028.1 nucleotidyltransferase family protein [Syntrophales bacterium]HOO00682.1 nucleotidyltransferase family protein [Syntrophales bacterium]HPC01941.1 nucleotidyltransferase family protein [Syntrophales bacterium]HPQ07454.1 nucleotidyltransferase family protein [Syntrophales bacterium]
MERQATTELPTTAGGRAAREAALDRALFALMAGRPVPSLGGVLVDPGLLTYLEANGVTGVLFHHLRQGGLTHLLPTEVHEALRRDFIRRSGRNMACLAEARKVFAALRDGGVPFLVLKGIALAEKVYPHPAMRGTSDLDVLIPKEDLLRADKALGGAGYRPGDGTPEAALSNPPGYLASLEYHGPQRAFSYVHLHWHLVNTSVPATAYAAKVDMGRIWARAVKADLAGMEVRLLCPGHLVAYLCEHALRVGHSCDRLILLCDLFYTLKTGEGRLDWDEAAAEAKALGISRFVYLALAILQSYVGGPYPGDEVLERFAPPSLSPGERLFLRLQENHRRFRGSSYLVHLALAAGPLAKARLILRTLFPPRAILAQRARRPMPGRTGDLYLARAREVGTHLVGFSRLLGGRAAKRSLPDNGKRPIPP